MVVFRSQKGSAAKKSLRKSWTERMYAHFFTTLQPTGLANTCWWMFCLAAMSTLYLREEGYGDPWLFFEAKSGPQQKKGWERVGLKECMLIFSPLYNLLAWPTHRLFCSNSSPIKAFLSSPNHRTLRISLRVTFGCSLLLKWASRGRVSQFWMTSNRKRRPNPRKIPKEAFCRCFQQWQDRWSKCVCAQGSYFEGD